MIIENVESRSGAGLLLLAGGRSSRMGVPKSLLPADPQNTRTFIELLVDRLAGEFTELLIAAIPELVPPSLRGHLVADLHPGAGPLAGIEAGLAATRTPVIFVAATDMPNLTPAAALKLVEASAGHDAAVPRLADGPEPLAAAYRISATAAITAALEDGSFTVRDALGRLDVSYVNGLDATLFENINTPDDHRRFLDAMRQSG